MILKTSAFFSIVLTCLKCSLLQYNFSDPKVNSSELFVPRHDLSLRDEGLYINLLRLQSYLVDKMDCDKLFVYCHNLMF